MRLVVRRALETRGPKIQKKRASPEDRDARMSRSNDRVLLRDGLTALVLAADDVLDVREALPLAGILALAGAGAALAGTLTLAGVGARALDLGICRRSHEAAGGEDRDRCGDHGLLCHFWCLP